MTDWVNLGRRQAGLPPESELVEGLPGPLFVPVKSWVDKTVVAVKTSYWDKAALRAGISVYASRGEELLTVVDFLLYWYPLTTLTDRMQWAPPYWNAHVADLDQILTLGRSVWRVNAHGNGLERRTEKPITSAMRESVAIAPPAAQDHLYCAWAAVYGRNPNPDLAYTEAIRAVEEVACPLVEPNRSKKGHSTLGTVIGELKNSIHRWELLLPDKDGKPSNISHLIGMLELLWHSHVSRHGGAPKSRRQDEDEARAATQLAVTLVHWLSTNVLRCKTSS